MGQPLTLPDWATSDQSRSLIWPQISMQSRAVLIGPASQAIVAALRLRSRASALAFFAASPRFSIAALRSLGIADFTASICDGSVDSASAAIEISTDWKRWKSW